MGDDDEIHGNEFSVCGGMDVISDNWIYWNSVQAAVSIGTDVVIHCMVCQFIKFYQKLPALSSILECIIKVSNSIKATHNAIV